MRNLWRYKGYTLINIIGLGIGIAAMVWGYQTYQFSFSFDNFHADKNEVYRALTYKEGGEGVKGIFPMPLVQMAQNDFPGITKAVRYDSRGLNIKSVQSEAFAEQVHFTDPSFFDLFNFPLVAGDNNISDQSAILLTEKTAKKYFGNENPIGKTLLLYAGETYSKPLTVKGVLKDIPVNSTIQFSFLTNFENQLKGDGSKIPANDWSQFLDAAFFKIPNSVDANALQEKLKKYLVLQNKAREDWKVSGFKLMTLKECASKSQYIHSNNLYERPGDSAAFGPFVLAFLIFLSACLNFSNITVARSSQRLKEIGMRKVMGSTRIQLIVQMLLECAAIIILAIGLSFLFNYWWLPVFNSMFDGVDVRADYLHDPNLLIFIAGMLIITSLLAGAYPAFYVSRFNPTTIFRGTVKFGGTNLFSRLMLGLQLSIAIITVIAGIAFAKNAAFQRTYDFGYKLENTMGVVVNDQNTYDALKNEVDKMPEVTAVAGTRHHIGFSSKNVVAETQGIKKEAYYLEVGRQYLTAMNLKTVEGRPFDTQMESDFGNALLITQKMAAGYGWKDKEALGKQVHVDSVDYAVIGVLKDFHLNTLFDPLEPVAMKLVKEDRFQFLIIQAKPADLTSVYNKTKDAWKKLFPLTPFNGFYQNQLTAESYRVSSSIAKIFSWFALVSILLTATGLFTLVSLTLLKKMREIALRKIVGATPYHIVVLINKGYVWIFLVASLLGCYGGWALTKLLLNMIFKINAGIAGSALIGSVTVLFIITAITIGIKVRQAIRSNPVKLLRTE